MSVDLIFSVIGIAVTLIAAFWGVGKLIKKKKVMKQSASKGAIAIQSGRDTKLND